MTSACTTPTSDPAMNSSRLQVSMTREAAIVSTTGIWTKKMTTNCRSCVIASAGCVARKVLTMAQTTNTQAAMRSSAGSVCIRRGPT